MESVTHRQVETVEVNGISMHVAEKGEGPVVLLLHGFPELWYSWRHQILGPAARGYRAVAPDLRGFGDTDAPAGHSSYSVPHIVGDLVVLISSLGQEKVFIVPHDWGAIVAWHLCLFRPDLVRALVAFMPHNPSVKPVNSFRAAYGDDFYICRFQIDLDLTYNYAGIQVYIHKGGLKKVVPLLEDVVVMESVGHFINEEKSEEINEHICHFIKKF